MSAPIYEMIEVKHLFTEEEKKEIAENMALRVQEVEQLEEEKKEFDKKKNEEIKSIQTVISLLAQHYVDGYRKDRKDCEVRRNFTDKTVEYIDPTSGEVVKERPMTSQESQMSFHVVGEDEEVPIVQRVDPGTGDH